MILETASKVRSTVENDLIIRFNDYDLLWSIKKSSQNSIGQGNEMWVPIILKVRKNLEFVSETR